MQMVTKELPKATIVSVAHRAELEAFHSRKITLERRKGGAKTRHGYRPDPAQGQAAPARPLPAQNAKPAPNKPYRAKRRHDLAVESRLKGRYACAVFSQRTAP